jgi:tetratricopeptide (TPR) repeat protein
LIKALKKSQDQGELNQCIVSELIPWLVDFYGLSKGSSVSELATVIKNKELVSMLQRAESSVYFPSSDEAIDFRALSRALKRLSMVLLLFFATNFLSADSFQDGIEAYESAQYEKAQVIFSTLQQTHLGSPSIAYNLGNCAYSQKNYAQALAWYERANRLAPRDTDIIQNLNFVRNKIGYEPLFAGKAPLGLLLNLRDHLRPDQWLEVATVLFTLLIILFCAERLTTRGFGLYKILSIFLILLALLSWQSQKLERYKSHAEAVLVNDTLLYRLPSIDVANSSGVEAKYGRLVKILEERPTYCLVKLDQAVGWVKKENLQFFWREE